MKIREELGFLQSGDTLPGFKDLDPEDKDDVKKKLPKTKSPTNGTNGNGTKRKMEDSSVDNASSKKAKKEEDEKQKLLKSQNQQMFRYRDALNGYRKSDLSDILTSNKQAILFKESEQQVGWICFVTFVLVNCVILLFSHL